MDKTEFARFVTIIRSGYQKQDFLKDVDSLSFWFSMLKDLPFELAVTALQKHVATSKWLPSVAEIRQCASEITLGEPRDWSDEWLSVIQAVRMYGYINEKDALATLSPLTKGIVRQLGWKNICCSEQNELTALRANFRMIYTQKAEREKENASLPCDVSGKISELSERLSRQMQLSSSEARMGAHDSHGEDFRPKRINSSNEK